MTSLTEENYLKALFHLSLRRESVTTKDISTDLNIKMPTVTSMMKKLSEKGLVRYESYKPIQLTSAGSRAAGIVVRKHRLTEMFLVDKMNFGWEEVHEIAEQIEHVKSSAFFTRMDQLLGFPTIDPHGSPIPNKEGELEWKEFVKLSEVQPGEDFVLEAVTNSEEGFLKYLNHRSLKLGLRLRILSNEDFDGSIGVCYLGDKEITLSNKVSERLLGKIVRP